MKKLRDSVLVLSVGLLIAVGPAYPDQGSAASDNPLDRQLTAIRLEKTTIAEAAVKALTSAGVPGGVAVIQGCGEPIYLNLTPVDSSLRSLLDSIVASDLRYEWTIEGGIINLIPRNGQSAFLDVRIPHVEIREAATLNDAMMQLLAVPEVQRQVKLNLGRQVVQVTGAYAFNLENPIPPENRRLSISLTDVTVREALNAIAQADGHAVWKLYQAQCGPTRKAFSIDFFPRL